MTQEIHKKFETLISKMDDKKIYTVRTLTGGEGKATKQQMEQWVREFDKYDRNNKQHVLSYANQIFKQI